MALVKPFQAIRPTPALAEKVAALPYDVMNSAEAREMVKGNPYSFLHVDKAEIDLPVGTDVYAPEVYAKAKENLDNMSKTGVMLTEDAPMFYLYRLTMNGRAQTGLVACTSIDEYLDNKIKKHELTLETKEQDRIRHVETCNANTGPIYLAYKAQAAIDALIADWCANNAPVYDFVAEDGIGHTIWTVGCPDTIAKLAEAFAKVPALYIADGHHRNASAVKVGLKKRAENPGYAADAEFNYYLSVIFPSNQLFIMDYNRVVKDLNGLSDDAFLAKIAEKFDIADSANGKPVTRHTFGMYFNGAWKMLTAKPGVVNEADPVASLDVSVLQDNVLTPLLGIDDPRTNKRIDFVGGMRGLGELSKRVDSGEMKVAFAMFPTSMDELLNIADEGAIMPPKSTWFEPKLRSGLFVHTL